MKLWLMARGYITGSMDWKLKGAEFLKKLCKVDGESLNLDLIPDTVQKSIRLFLRINIEPKVKRIDPEEAAFESKYVATGSLSALETKINTVSAAKGCYSSFEMFQASGYGKSRLVLENAKKNHFTIFWCLKPEDCSGYPEQSFSVFFELESLLYVSQP